MLEPEQSFLVINQHGQLIDSETNQPISHEETMRELLSNIKMTENFALTTTDGEKDYIVEAYDHPYMAQKILADQNGIWIVTQDGQRFLCQSDKFSFDFADRLCGMTQKGVPFRLSEMLHLNFFEELDSFDDDHFVFKGIKIQTPSYYFENSEISKAIFWENVYRTDGNPTWNLQEPAAALREMLPTLKLPKSRILVLGCGEGHDAALFAQSGHVVTAVDFSKVAIQEGQKKYSHVKNLTFLNQDIFSIDTSWNHSFDLIVEHTCFCALPPEKRKNLVDLWSRLLHEQGQLMGVFFAMLKRAGPPYGSSEIELRTYIEKKFQVLVWHRYRNSIPRRAGRELYVLANKKKF